MLGIPILCDIMVSANRQTNGASTNGVNGYAARKTEVQSAGSGGQPLDLTVLGLNSGTSMVGGTP